MQEPATPPLSERQWEVMRMAAGGLSQKEIAAQMGISHQTVKNHLSDAYHRLGVGSLQEALVASGLMVRPASQDRVGEPIVRERRPLVVTTGVVEETRASFEALLAYGGLPVLGRDEVVEERWREVIRRCNGWPLSLRDAAFVVLDEWRTGRPTCWLR